jgi:ribosomal protein L3 glutamine methyltransferase
MRLMDLVESVSQRLTEAGVSFGHGTTNAFDEAAWLVLWQLGVPLDALDELAQRRIGRTELRQIDALVARRIQSRRPAAYLTGEAWLQGVPFYVDERVIVPRSLIAEPLANGTLSPWLPAHSNKVLDLCTGNGSLAVLSAMAWPDVTVLGTDISRDALAVAKSNVQRHDLGKRVRLVQGDGFQAAPGRFDLILCNPPYVNQTSMAALPAEYLAEPKLALAGGADGMDFIRKLMAEVKQHLSDHGVLVLEVGNERAHFEAAFPKQACVWLPTSAGDDQVLLIEASAMPAVK